jgi:gamma-D-glutamyl-L-lysine dipeptidyl-peptidase
MRQLSKIHKFDATNASMIYAVCCVPVSPVRMEPDHKSEMSTQQLFGECCIVREKRGVWINICTCFDEEEGWCLESQVTEIPLSLFNRESELLCGDWCNNILIADTEMRIPFGCSLTGMVERSIEWCHKRFQFDGNAFRPTQLSRSEATFRNLAFRYLHTPYLWGGKSVFGVDCSGFVQSVYKSVGIRLRRNASQQAQQGEVVNFLLEAKCGDLAFFDNEEGRIIHVGLLLNDHEVIHAAGTVRVDKIDNEGILHAETFQRTHHLRIIKRMVSSYV